MELQELLEFLNIETPRDFQYFENMSDLMDCDYNIPSEILFKIFSDVNDETVLELIEEYFDDILSGVPENETDLFGIIDTEKTVLSGLVSSGDEDRNIANFSDELERFREWYVFDSRVSCRNISTGDVDIETVRDALAMKRAESFGGEEHEYDFSDACDYEVDEYIVNVQPDYYDYGDDDIPEPDAENEKEELLNSNFLYDDELRDN